MTVCQKSFFLCCKQIKISLKDKGDFLEMYFNFYSTDKLNQIFLAKSKEKIAEFYFFDNGNNMLYLGRSNGLYLTLYQHINEHAQPTYKHDVFRLFTRLVVYKVEEYDPIILEIQKELLVNLFKPAMNIKFTDKPWRAADRILTL